MTWHEVCVSRVAAWGDAKNQKCQAAALCSIKKNLYLFTNNLWLFHWWIVTVCNIYPLAGAFSLLDSLEEKNMNLYGQSLQTIFAECFLHTAQNQQPLTFDLSAKYDSTLLSMCNRWHRSQYLIYIMSPLWCTPLSVLIKHESYSLQYKGWNQNKRNWCINPLLCSCLAATVHQTIKRTSIFRPSVILNSSEWISVEAFVCCISRPSVSTIDNLKQETSIML